LKNQLLEEYGGSCKTGFKNCDPQSTEYKLTKKISAWGKKFKIPKMALGTDLSLSCS
jgi:hypothetical protein